MAEREQLLQQYVGNMIALERHIMDACDRQTKDEDLSGHPDALNLVSRIRSMSEQHVLNLERNLSRLGGSPTTGVKEAVAAALGAAAGMLDKMRAEPVSKMLRDDYTALALAAISYTQLHTTGLVLRDQATSDAANTHLREITPLITEIGEIMPQVVEREISGRVPDAATMVAEQSRTTTQEAWEASHVHDPQARARSTTST